MSKQKRRCLMFFFMVFSLSSSKQASAYDLAKVLSFLKNKLLLLAQSLSEEKKEVLNAPLEIKPISKKEQVIIEKNIGSFKEMEDSWNKYTNKTASIPYPMGKVEYKSFDYLNMPIDEESVISIKKKKPDKCIDDSEKNQLRNIINEIGSYGAVHLKDNLDYFLQKTMLCSFGDCELGKPRGAWYRKVFEEKFANYVEKNLTQKKDLTYVSIGSGSLWQDFVLLDRLVQKGCSFANFVFIDSSYISFPWIRNYSENISSALKYDNEISAEGVKNKYSLEGGILFFLKWFNNVPISLFTDTNSYVKYLNVICEDKVALNADILVCVDVPGFGDFKDLKEKMKDSGIFAILADEFPEYSRKTGFVLGVKGSGKAFVSNFVDNTLQTQEQNEDSLSYATGVAKFD